ncbi:MAG: outer membrane lipid asymmetry maintenance protein MlaD [Pseudomonadota bacterium]
MRGQWIEFLAGTVVLIVAVGFGILGLQRAGVGGAGGSDYTLTASFRSVEGISVGTDVRMAGVKIGTVTDLTLNAQTFLADTSISVDQSVELPDDSTILIASEGLLGGSFVEIQPGGSPFNLGPGDAFTDTQSSVSLLTLLTRFVTGGGD